MFLEILLIFIFIIIFIYSIIIHEVSHGLVADYLGDPTARLMKRLSLNPIVHIDLFGSIILPLFLMISQTGFIFGWAKPVPYDPYNLKNPRKDSALISLAGPGSNLIIALLSALLIRLLIFFDLNILTTIGTIVLTYIIRINIILGIFNLLPIHPLDGFKVVAGLLPKEKAAEWYGLERFGFIFLLLMIIPFSGSSMLSGILQPTISFLLRLLIPINGGVI